MIRSIAAKNNIGKIQKANFAIRLKIWYNNNSKENNENKTKNSNNNYKKK